MTPSQSSSTPLQVSAVGGRVPRLRHTATPVEQSSTPMTQMPGSAHGAPLAQGTQSAAALQTLDDPGSQRIELPAGATPAVLKPTRSIADPVSRWRPTVALLPVARSP